MQLFSFLLAAPLVSSVIAWSPSNGYAPANVSCPSDFNLIREASSQLSDNETEWLSLRNEVTSEALQNFLNRATRNFTNSSLIDDLFSGNSSNVPKIGIACSGGGYRAMLSGAGMIAAFDNRTVGANENGLGGLLQSTTYLAGLSGGNWLTGTLALNNWTSVQDIVDNMGNNGSIWDISNSLVTQDAATVQLWTQVFQAIASKQEAGFNTTLADYWGRALSYDFFPTLPQGGAGLTWSTIRDSDVFRRGLMPFPISVTDVRHPYSGITYMNSTIVEFNPFEMGSWDPSLNSFADVKFIGSDVSNGTAVNEGQCIAGFDNAGFVLGTSSTLFTPSMVEAVELILGNSTNTTVGELLISMISNDNEDVALFAPNPFRDSAFGSNSDLSSDPSLFLADGGEDTIEVPLISLIQKQRDLDVVFAFDNSADTVDSWPNGTAMVGAYRRQFSEQGQDIAFPYVPDEETFVSEGLNKRPTFFGCDARNLTELSYIPPLLIYVPNADYSFASNTSTLQLQYSEAESKALIQNGFEAATRGNLTDDSRFMGCVACAVMRRKQQSMNATLPAECNACLAEYCWTGTAASIPDDITNSTSTNTSSSVAESSSATDQSTLTTSTVSSRSSTRSATGSATSSSANSAAAATTSSTRQNNAGNSLMETSKFAMSFVFVLNLFLGNL
ncbi:hypothetical protein Kpol_1023p23 [Vanderwaltozyma polyspora DSM 70294]|uniref:Lysophospholipase n=1 Tax=Vanderwaltozyma polyspora (strain ATCC 22028 / DSM 70294 / BCRC 21397 / CBS 2163 / NBRC 10782 / NRRL Y-8283 / UCD 57-17) TaxID=436907 RepID=A7TFP6_VANPO|nr:uncharacterized protein Kpol_1023p23 [Vanderwaltozyma polyspora DSM 70294]EDO18854.1 hypothetical protein Kpol_1023p23 [Vanderwaltozyma polyspora DSM 70294]